IGSNPIPRSSKCVSLKIKRGVIEMLKYYIVYPRGDKSKLSIISLGDSDSYELADYAVASRRDFDDVLEVIEYARDLARKNGLELSSSEDEIKKELNYLD
ncbi:MAG: hypothetical protein RSC74_09235, partial [Hydrogenoanaerobacterium sp.]